MAINKVIYDADTLVDLTEDTVTAEDVLNSKSFHTSDGVKRTGTASYPVTDVQVNGTSVMDGTVAKVVQPTADEQTATDTFETINGGLLSSLKVSLTPKQDLHGYDHPWVGGAGKNKLPLTVNGIKSANTSGTWSGNEYTIRGITYTIQTDNSGNVIGILINGTNSSNVNAELNLYTNNSFYFSNGDYVLSGGYSNLCRIFYYNGVNYYDSRPNPVSFTVDGTETANRCTVAVSKDTTLNNTVVYPMIRLASISDATFEPYSNICPISGHTEVDLYNVGKNFISYKRAGRTNAGVVYTVNNGVITAKGLATARSYSSSTSSASIATSFLIKAGTYILSGAIQNTSIALYTVDENGTVTSLGEATYNTPLGVTLSEDSYVFYNVIVENGTSINHTFSVQLEKGSSPTAYEPYQGKLYQVQIGSTVYGGYVDLVSGVMTVTYFYIEYDGSSDENWNVNTTNIPFFTIGIPNVTAGANIYSNEFASTVVYSSNYNIGVYASSNQLRVRPDLITITVDAFRTWLSNHPLQIAVVIDNPTVINLIPQQIETLVGQNNLSTPLDGQSIDSVEYREVFAFDDVEKVVSLRVPISMLGTDESGRTTASQSYASGDYFYKDGYMCKALTSISAGATLTLNTNYEYSTLDEILESKVNKSDIYANAGSHNSIYRGKYLGSSVTAEQWTAIQNGTFDDLFIGDYWTINGVNWRIAHFDYWLGTGDTECTDHHVVIVPDDRLYTVKMNSSSTVTGGYYSSEMRGGANYLVSGSSNLYQASEDAKSAFGSAHILTHRELIVNAITDGKASAYSWNDSSVEIMNEIMICGTFIFALGGATIEMGSDFGQFELFRLNPSFINIRRSYWLRNIASSTNFSEVNVNGLINSKGASQNNGVRPCFAIK